MSKIIILKLSSIEYSGDSIGDDFRIEAEALTAAIVIDKKLRPGKVTVVNKEIGQFVTDQSSIPVHIRLIEKDPVFNDVGSARIVLSIDSSSETPRSSTHAIKIVESGGILGDSTAVLHVKFETRALEVNRYIGKGRAGWLTVLPDPIDEKFGLPTGLRVRLDRLDSKREYFTIMEGVRRGEKASVQLESDGTSNLSPKNPHKAAVKLVYSISRKTLQVKGKTYLAKEYPSRPWRKGWYDVEIADFPHAGGLIYPEAVYARTWFRVGHEGDRYIHTGRGTLGCITLLELERWDGLYAILINARKGDGLSIGTLRVVD